MLNKNLIQMFLVDTFNQDSKKGIKSAKASFAALIKEFELWAEPQYGIEGESKKDEEGNVCFYFNSQGYWFYFSLNSEQDLQLIIKPHSNEYMGFDKSFEFVTSNLDLTWDEIYLELKEATHSEWKKVADNLTLLDKGWKYRRKHTGYTACLAGFSGGYAGFDLVRKGESSGCLNLYEVAKIKNDYNEIDKKERGLIIYNQSDNKKFYELKPHYSLMQPIKEFEECGVQYFKFKVHESELVFSVSEYFSDESMGKRIRTLMVHNLYEEGETSEWKNQWEKWIIECYLNQLSKFPERIINL